MTVGKPDWMYAEGSYSYFIHYETEDSLRMEESSAIADVAGGLAYQIGGEYGYEIIPWTKVWKVEHKKTTFWPGSLRQKDLP